MIDQSTAAPMFHHGATIGVLEVLNKNGGADYDESDARILQILADQAAIAIVNARLVRDSIESERLAAIGLAVSGIAHHLKNIIQSLKGSVGLVQMGVSQGEMQIIERCMPILSRG